MANDLLIQNLSEPLNGAATAAVDINVGDGNLTVDTLAAGEQLLATGTLQYFEKQGVPTRTVDVRSGRANLTLRGGQGPTRRSWFRMPWSACVGGAYEWQIHLNPRVSSDITAHSDGGNVKLNLAGMAVRHLAADTGGGNMEVVLPDGAANLNATAKTGGGNVTVEVGEGIKGSNRIEAGSGAGNVVVHVPKGVAIKVHATSGLGKVIMDPRLSKIDDKNYQSLDYDHAADKLEVTLKSGAGNVIVDTR